MTVIDELHRLAELHERGQVSSAEYHEAKKQLLAARQQQNSGATSDGAFLL
ncbi:MAG: SHOCT domain-containing protein [Actinobacteria bacterium]|nr:SHOCT domain-containing protein [Actinomycetota bacterium]